jgi:tetratricopeptide (TPR) repeat protein
MLAFAAQKAFSATETTSLVLRVALEHHQQGKLQEAAALYLEVRRLDPGNGDALFLLGLIALTVQNDSAAERLLTFAAQRMPKAAHVHRALGEARSRGGQHGPALESYWRALALDPLNAASYTNVGEALMAVKPDGGNSALATACFARALLLDAACPRAHDGLRELRSGSVRQRVAKRLQTASLEVCPVQ